MSMSKSNNFNKEVKLKYDLGEVIAPSRDLTEEEVDTFRKELCNTDVTVKSSDYWKQRKANYDNIKSAEDFNRIVGNPVMDSIKKHRGDLFNKAILLQVFNESWCDSINRYRLSFMESIELMNLDISKYEDVFGIPIGISNPSADGLTKAIKECVNSSESLSMLYNEEDKGIFLNYCVKRAQLMLAEHAICPFDYYDNELSSDENLRVFKDLHLLELKTSIIDLEIKLMTVIPESCKLTKGFEDFLNPNLDYHTEMSNVLTEDYISERLRMLNSTQEGPGRSHSNNKETKPVDASELRTVSKDTDYLEMEEELRVRHDCYGVKARSMHKIVFGDNKED